MLDEMEFKNRLVIGLWVILFLMILSYYDNYDFAFMFQLSHGWCPPAPPYYGPPN